MSPVDFATLVKDVVEIAMIKRPSGQYDQVDLDGDLSSRKGDILPLAILVLREQFGDFFSAALANGARAMAAKGSQSVK
jgi:hypothetical protein